MLQQRVLLSFSLVFAFPSAPASTPAPASTLSLAPVPGLSFDLLLGLLTGGALVPTHPAVAA